jgi:hypothetical protein
MFYDDFAPENTTFDAGLINSFMYKSDSKITIMFLLLRSGIHRTTLRIRELSSPLKDYCCRAGRLQSQDLDVTNMYQM